MNMIPLPLPLRFRSVLTFPAANRAKAREGGKFVAVTFSPLLPFKKNPRHMISFQLFPGVSDFSPGFF
jgi:hypothetical protein